MKKTESLIYTNANGESLILSLFSVYKVKSFHDTGLENEITATKNSSQDGETMMGSALGSRSISIEGFFRYNGESNATERYLRKVFNPKLKGVLVFRDIDTERHITVIPEEMPDIERALRSTRYSINLLAHDPFWREAEKTEEISLLEPLLTFPLVIRQSGFIFGRKRASLETIVDNKGDVASGFRVIFAARGAVENPAIRNGATGKQIKILYTMEQGDIIEVINQPSVKQVLINGEKAFKYLDRRNSSFFQLEVGKNTIGYQADTNTVNLDVAVFYSPLYL